MVKITGIITVLVITKAKLNHINGLTSIEKRKTSIYKNSVLHYNYHHILTEHPRLAQCNFNSHIVHHNQLHPQEFVRAFSPTKCLASRLIWLVREMTPDLYVIFAFYEFIYSSFKSSQLEKKHCNVYNRTMVALFDDF